MNGPRRWVETYVTGTAEANARLEVAQDALESFDGPCENPQFWRLTVAVDEALQGVPWPRRFGWI